MSSTAKGAKLAKTASPTAHAAMRINGKDTGQETQQQPPHLQEESPREQETGTSSGEEDGVTPQAEGDEAEKEGVGVAPGFGDHNHSGEDADKSEKTAKAKTEE